MIAVRLKTVFLILAGVLLFCGGLFVGYRIFAPNAGPQTVINTQMILTALHARRFLVTRTYIFDTPVTIDRNTGNAFKDFFFGQTIEARGTMEVNLGVDLTQIKPEDITLNGLDGTVTIKLPGASLFNARLVGPIELRNRQGILKRLLDSEDGYNDALTALRTAAEQAATRPELLQSADEQAREDVRILLQYVTPGNVVKVQQK